MKLGIIGYGKMGKLIHQMANDQGIEIALIIDQENLQDLTSENLLKADVIIEFSQPESAPSNLLACFNAKVPVVCGTTGWHRQLTQIKEACIDSGGGLFVASNFSIGVNLLFRINKLMARWAHQRFGYQASIDETHHIHKKDAPSGTAVTLADGILESSNLYQGWALDPIAKPDHLAIRAFREDEVPGTHEVKYRSEVDEIVLRHEAFSRAGFAAGAIEAAQFMVGRTGIFTMEDLMQFD